MNFSRCLAAVVCLLILSAAARANDLFVVDISTRTYMLNGKGELVFRAGNQREIIDLAAENSSVAAKYLVLVYDYDTDALEVVRRDDGTPVYTYMTFIDGTQVATSGQKRLYRQTFIAIPDTAIVSGTTAVSGTTPVSGSVAGPVRVSYASSHPVDYHWDGSFQFTIPGDMNSQYFIVHGRFTLGRKLHVPATP